jgi:hypothetical protein
VSQYAQSTKVEVLSSQADILKLLAKFGVEKHAFMNDGDSAAVAFTYGGLNYKISVLTPDPEHEAFRYTEAGRARTAEAARSAHVQEIRRRWRSLVLLVKAKLVAVDDDISTFEQEWMPYIMTGTGETLFEAMQVQIEKAKQMGGTIPALPGRNN